MNMRSQISTVRYSDASDSDSGSDSPSVSDDEPRSVSSLSDDEECIDLNKLVFRRIGDKGKLAKSDKTKSIDEILHFSVFTFNLYQFSTIKRTLKF